MKQLWPENPQPLKEIGTTTRKVTYDDILDLIDRIENLSTLFQNHTADFEEYKTALQETITTGTIHVDELHSLKAFLQSIESESIVADEASIEEISAIGASIEKIESGEGIFDKVTSGEISSEKVTTDSLTSNSIETKDLHTENLSVDRYEIDHVEGNTGTFTSLESEDVKADAITATEVNADVVATVDVVSETGKIDALESDEITVTDVKHTTFKVIEGAEDIYIHLPVLLGKTVYLIKDEDEKKVALQVLNTENNVTVMWSDFAKPPIRYLIDSNFVEMGNYSILILHLKGLVADFELYAYNDFTDDIAKDFVTYSDDWHIPDSRISSMGYIFGYRNGTKFFRNLDLDKDGGEVHALTGNFTKVYDDTDDDSFTYDTSETIEKLFYRPDQEVNTDSDVEHHDLHLTGALYDGTDVEDDEGNVIGYEGDEASILATNGETLEWKKGTDRQILREKEIEKDGEKVLSLEYEDPVDNVDYPTSLVRNDLIPTQETIANYNGTVEGESGLVQVFAFTSADIWDANADDYFDKTDVPSKSVYEYTPKEGYIARNDMLGTAISKVLVFYGGGFQFFNEESQLFAASSASTDHRIVGSLRFNICEEKKEVDYPISELRDNTTTHGNHTVENILEVKNKIKEDVYIGEHVFVGEKSDNSRLTLTDYSLVLEEEDE